MKSKVIRHIPFFRFFREQKVRPVLGSYEVLDSPKDLMLVVNAKDTPKPGDLVEVENTFALVKRPSRYTKLLEMNGAGKEDDFEPELNLKFSVVHLHLLDNLETIKYASETRKKIRLPKSKKR